jgi:glucose-6-phosphate isomerase
MFPKIDFTTTAAYAELQGHAQRWEKLHIRQAFAEDPQRFNKFAVCQENMVFDYSKNRIDEDVMQSLFKLAGECKLDQAIEAMFSGESINETEGRAVLHTALRDNAKAPVMSAGVDVKPEIRQVQKHIRRFSNRVISGEWKGYSGKSIQQIVNIGIGGSDLGPVMVTEALKAYSNHLKMHFVSNVDGTHIAETLKKLDPERTLFIIASKTFTTQETMTNAHTARSWFLEKGTSEKDIEKHFIALSTNTEGVKQFGIHPDNIFRFWDWVGGRYSLWSAIGTSIALAIGYDGYQQLLDGAHEMDLHFKEKGAESIPGIMALLGIWYNNFMGAQSHAILPYDQYMHRFSAYFSKPIWKVMEREPIGMAIK